MRGVVGVLPRKITDEHKLALQKGWAQYRHNECRRKADHERRIRAAIAG